MAIVKLPGFGGGRKRQTKAYRAYLLSPQWRELKKRILKERTKCEHCGATNVILQLHHKTYERLGQERDEDLELLCIKCHKKADRERAKAVRYENAKATYIRKKYGDRPPSYADAEFHEWWQRRK